MLTSGINQQLSILRQNSEMSAKVAQRIATGQRINSSADGAFEYSVATRLRERASTIDSVLSQMTKTKTGISAATTSLSAVSDMIDQATTIANAATSTSISDAERAAYQEQYEDIIAGINDLIGGASVNGRNILAGHTDKVTLESGDEITVGGDTVTATSLGLVDPATVDADGVGGDGAGWGDPAQGIANVQLSLDHLEAATSNVNALIGKLENQNFIMQVHENFAKSMQSLYLDNAVSLTAADQNEESANLKALQTQAQLSSTSLSILAQAQNNVLRLF